MPALAAVPWLVPLLTAASAATTVGLGIDEALTKGGSSGPTAAQTQAENQAKTLAQQKAAFINAQNSGSGPTSGNTPSGPTPDQIQAMLKLLNPAQGGGNSSVNISGGFNGGATPPPQVTNGLTNLAV